MLGADHLICGEGDQTFSTRSLNEEFFRPYPCQELVAKRVMCNFTTITASNVDLGCSLAGVHRT